MARSGLYGQELFRRWQEACGLVDDASECALSTVEFFVGSRAFASPTVSLLCMLFLNLPTSTTWTGGQAVNNKVISKANPVLERA